MRHGKEYPTIRWKPVDPVYREEVIPSYRLIIEACGDLTPEYRATVLHPPAASLLSPTWLKLRSGQSVKVKGSP